MSSVKTRVLCFGDSNTWGSVPGTFSQERYGVDSRWPAVLQAKLQSEIDLIEEGLPGRTTAIDDPDEEGKNGQEALTPALKQHAPLDVVVLMLGTNDLKAKYNQTPEDIATNIKTLVEIIRGKGLEAEYTPPKHILLISPSFVVEPELEEYKTRLVGAEPKSLELGALYQKVAEEFDIGFLDAAKILTPSSIDGIHFTEEAHKSLAEAVVRELSRMLGISKSWVDSFKEPDSDKSRGLG